MGGSYDAWFKKIVAEYPPAAEHQKEVDWLINEMIECASDSAFFQRQLDEVKEELKKVNDMDAYLSLRRKHEIDKAAVHFEKSSAYANLIISAGYAALLASWTTTFEKLTPMNAKLIGGLALFSLFFFVLWEVLKMISAAFEARSHSKAMDVENNELAESLSVYSDLMERWSGYFYKGWVFQLFLTVPTGLAAGILLVYELLIPRFSI